MTTEWDLRAFIFGLDDLDDDEKEQCFSILDGQGFSAAKKRVAFFALDDADLRTVGISQLSTRKVLRLALAASAAGLGMGSAAGAGLLPAAADQKLYKNVTVFVPASPSEYVKRDYKMLSKKQFVDKMMRNNYCQVVPVDKQPSQLLALRDCADTAVDIDDVQLQDGMRLAVVAGAEYASNKIKQTVETIQGWMEPRIDADENECAEWAVAYLAGDQGAKHWGFKTITGLVYFEKVQIAIDGMAFSEERVVLVERKPRINLMYVYELWRKVKKLIQLVAAGAPNTAMLRNPAKGLIKPLEVFLMADDWVDDPDEVAACAVGMEDFGITPLLPTGDGGYTQHDSCGRWPVDASTRRRGKKHLKRLGPRPQWSGSGAGMDASTGRGAGGAAGPNSAVGVGRHASCQQAACSPAHPAHYLRAHDPFRATGGAGLRRSVAPVCRPLHLHLPRQHRSSMLNMRRL